jgi:hypothetical protein
MVIGVLDVDRDGPVVGRRRHRYRTAARGRRRWMRCHFGERAQREVRRRA